MTFLLKLKDNFSMSYRNWLFYFNNKLIVHWNLKSNIKLILFQFRRNKSKMWYRSRRYYIEPFCIRRCLSFLSFRFGNSLPQFRAGCALSSGRRASSFELFRENELKPISTQSHFKSTFTLFLRLYFIYKKYKSEINTRIHHFLIQY